MKIIGGHDYYDGAGFGVDTTVVLVRDKARSFRSAKQTKGHPFPHAWSKSVGSYLVSFFLTVISGEIYPGIKFTKPEDSFTLKGEVTFIYSKDEAIKKLNQIYDETGKNPSTPAFLFGSGKTLLQHVSEHMSQTINKKQLDWLIDHHFVIFTVYQIPYEREENYGFANHSLLKEIDFYKCIDPATIHMKIAGFISGVLPVNRETIEISDLDKIQKAGFDRKLSFRNGPTKLKRKA